MPNSPKAYEKFAKDNGFKKIVLDKYTKVSDFAEMNGGVFICHIREHLLCIKNHTIYDLWNCGEYKFKTFYEKQNS